MRGLLVAFWSHMARPPNASIRIPTPLRERVAAVAAGERRSFSGQVIVLLEGAVTARERAQKRAEREFVRELTRTFDAHEVDR